MKPIILSSKQRQELEQRRKGTFDRRLYQRLTAVLMVAAGLTRGTVATSLGVSRSQLGEWLRQYRNQGIDALCTLHYHGDPGKLTAPQLEQLKETIATGCFRTAQQIC